MSDKHKIASAGYSVTLFIKLTNKVGSFCKITSLLSDLEASLGEVELISSSFEFNYRKITVSCKTEDHIKEIEKAVGALENVEVIESTDDTFQIHKGGKLSVNSNIDVRNQDALARAYTPGVARVCSAISEKKELAYEYTIKKNTVAVVSDGTAVLGLGDIGPEAGMPVMEGKSLLFKEFAGVDSFPICLDTKDTQEIIDTCVRIAPTFGGINLEDISAPRCFEIEDKLRELLDIPVFHDDQHGTAVVVLAGLINSLKIVKKNMSDLKVVVSGFGAGGVACSKILINAGVTNLIPCDSVGIVYKGRPERMNDIKNQMLEITNPDSVQGSLADALKDADVFIGVSKPGVLTRELVKTMAKDPIIFALANPVPEVYPNEIADIAGVIATGRSDYANQINNVLCFPGIFKGALDCRATKITENMKLAAANAIADTVTDDKLSPTFVIPGAFYPNIADLVAEKVKEAAITDGVARI